MSTAKFLTEIKINTNQGGKAAIDQLVEAYGFTTRQALADHLEVSKSTLANRYMRDTDTFPADWTIQCVLETGISLRWLANSEGPMHIDAKAEIITINKERIQGGSILESGYLHFDSYLLPDIVDGISAIESNNVIYIINRNIVDIDDGMWMILIDGICSIRELVRLPNNSIMLDAKTKNRM